ncbi:cysteine protease, partial [Aphelenchoides avenae]
VPQDFMYYAGGVYETNCAQPFAGGHGMTIVGYTSQYWIIKNSWGSADWGDAGYIYWSRTSPVCFPSKISSRYNDQTVGVTWAGAVSPTTAPATTASSTTTTPLTTAAPATSTSTPATSSPVTASPGCSQCPAGYTYFAGTQSCYKITSGLTFDAAGKECAQAGGTLASIHSAAENDFIS